MLDSNQPDRCWQDIVAEVATASHKHDFLRLAELRKELESVLDHRNKALHAKAKSDKKLPARKI
jgi:K+-sensing histidine kinase KdpD